MCACNVHINISERNARALKRGFNDVLLCALRILHRTERAFTRDQQTTYFDIYSCIHLCRLFFCARCVSFLFVSLSWCIIIISLSSLLMQFSVQLNCHFSALTSRSLNTFWTYVYERARGSTCRIFKSLLYFQFEMCIKIAFNMRQYQIVWKPNLISQNIFYTIFFFLLFYTCDKMKC